jgi:hypothetical protein
MIKIELVFMRASEGTSFLGEHFCLVPLNSRILTITYEPGGRGPVLFFEVTQGALDLEYHARRFHIIGPGGELDAPAEFVGSFLTPAGPLPFFVYMDI